MCCYESLRRHLNSQSVQLHKLTLQRPLQVYGASIQFYEAYPQEALSEQQRMRLGLVSVVDRRPITSRSLQVKKSVCVLSRFPFFEAFHKFLNFVYRYSISGPHVLPLER